ncbi:response regulator [Colwellia piezophila]|uniref:response regulator n=1 Tax=Colwellia piezophila TaxID=211668 RepID=UPI0003A5A9EA|nr:response regulator [Colwellia piezophila]
MGKLILVVDDSRAMRYILTVNLESFGYNVVEAEDGLDGLSKARINKFDLIITDINMPNMNGYELIKCLRVEKKHQYIPILATSIESCATAKKQGKEAGVTGWIVKPFDPAKLEVTVKRVL